MRLRAHPADDTASKTKRRGRQLQAAARQQREPQESEPQVRFPYFQKTKKPLDSDFSFGAGDGNRTFSKIAKNRITKGFFKIRVTFRVTFD